MNFEIFRKLFLTLKKKTPTNLKLLLWQLKMQRFLGKKLYLNYLTLMFRMLVVLKHPPRVRSLKHLQPQMYS